MGRSRLVHAGHSLLALPRSNHTSSSHARRKPFLASPRQGNQSGRAWRCHGQADARALGRAEAGVPIYPRLHKLVIPEVLNPAQELLNARALVADRYIEEWG